MATFQRHPQHTSLVRPFRFQSAWFLDDRFSTFINESWDLTLRLPNAIDKISLDLIWIGTEKSLATYSNRSESS